jgi:hypothetical protein
VLHAQQPYSLMCGTTCCYAQLGQLKVRDYDAARSCCLQHAESIGLDADQLAAARLAAARSSNITEVSG